MGETIISRHADVNALVEAAATRFVEVVTAAQAARGCASVVLTGGGAGIAMLERLREIGGAIDWKNLDIYWGDDRFLPADDPERNQKQAYDALLAFVALDPARVHPMSASDGEFGDDIHAATADYAQLLDAASNGQGTPEFDLHLLGMGPEGHINSLFPHTAAVREESAFVVAVTDSPKPPPTRITLTLPAVRRAKQVWLLVSGAGKADAARECLNGASADDWPAAGAYGTEETVWFVDEAAASEL